MLTKAEARPLLKPHNNQKNRLNSSPLHLIFSATKQNLNKPTKTSSALHHRHKTDLHHLTEKKKFTVFSQFSTSVTEFSRESERKRA